MKKILLTLILAFTFIGVHAQCTPDPQYVLPGIYPDSTTGLVNGFVGQAYNEVITIVVPLDTTYQTIPVTFLDIELDTIIGLPANFSYSCAPANCSFPGGSSGCISIFSTSNPTVADTGLYHIYVRSTATVDAGLLGVFSLTDTIDYSIEILPVPLTYGCTDSTAFNYDPTATIDDGSCTYQVTNCSDLFFSEYVEGTVNNQALEIYNPTSSIVNLNDYYIKRYSNGATVSDDLQLSGSLQPHDVVVVTNGQLDSVWNSSYWSLPVDPQLYNLGDLHCSGIYPTPFYFNGDDALTLEKSNGTIVDIFGKVGEDPGGAWTDDASAGYTDANGGTWWTKRQTLVRKPAVIEGITQNPILFNPTLEYDSLPDATYTGLGFHNCLCNSSVIYGCIDPLACNYDPAATIDDGSCDYTTSSSVDVQTACDTYTWLDGITYTASTNSSTWVTYDPITGCSNVATLNLTINNSTTSVDVQTACDTYTWLNGVTYTASNNSATWTTINPITGCSLVATLNLTILAIPTAPAAMDEAVCEGMAVIPALTAIGTSLTWYNDVALTTVVGNGPSFTTGQTAAGVYTYYVTETNVSGCEGPSTTVTLEIFAMPPAPTAISETACEGDPIPDLTATGTNVTWYDDAALTIVVGNGSTFTPFQTVVGVYTYYVTETNNAGAGGCEGPASPVTLEIFALPSAPIATNAVVCEGSVIPDLTATGTNLTWYDDPALAPTNQVGTGNSFATGQTTAGVYTYYVTETDANGCEGPSTTVTLEIFALPPAPISINSVVVCEGEGISLTATGTNVTWYDDAALTNVVGTGSTFTTLQTVVGVYTYYVTQNINGCESTAGITTLTVYPLPVFLLVPSNVSCYGF